MNILEQRRQRQRDLAIFRILIIRCCFITNGIFSNTPQRNLFEKMYSIFFSLIMLFTFIGTMISLNRVHQNQAKMDISLYSISIVICMIRHIAVQYNRLRLLDFSRLVANDQYLDNEVFFRSMNRFKKICKPFCTFLVIHFINVTLLPFSKSWWRKKFTYTIPYFLSCDTVAYSGDTVCWDPQNGMEYFVKNSILTLTFLSIILPFATNLILFTFIVIWVRVNVEIIQNKMERLTGVQRAFGSMETEFEDDCVIRVHEIALQGQNFESENIRNLSRLMTYYGKFFRIMSGIYPYINFLASFYLLIFYSLSMVNWLLLLGDTKVNASASFVVTFTSSVSVFYLGFSAFCYGGQVIKDMNLEIAGALYNTPWYQESIKYRRQVYRFQLLLQRSLRLKALYSVETELRMSLIMLSRLYSAFNVILSVVRNK